MMGDKKKGVTAILGPLAEEHEGEEPNELHAIAQELIEAVHGHDVEAVAHALTAAVDVLNCAPSEGESED